MAKFTIIYRRTIQTKKYHTSTIGLSQEYDTADTPWEAAFMEVQQKVEEWIKFEREALTDRG